MKNTVILTYVESTNTIEWAIYSPTKHIIDAAQTTLLSDLSQKLALKKYHIWVLIQSAEICIRELSIPKNISESKYPKIIPNLLEEEILSSIEDVHFCYTKRPDKKLCVAIVSKQKIEDWLHTFKSHGIEPQKMIPLSLALPYSDKTWTVQFDSQMAHVRTGLYAGFSIESHQVAILLDDFYQTADIKPLHIHFVNSHKHDLAGLSLQAYSWAHLITYGENTFWENIQIPKNTINLLQRTYQSTHTQKIQTTLKIHFLLFIFALFFLFTGLEVKKYIFLSKYHRELDHHIQALYKELYPNATAVVNPKARMSQELTSAASSDAHFFSLLFDMGSVLNTTPAIILKNLSYKNKILNITIEAKNYAEVEAFLIQLKQHGLHIEQKETTQQKEKLNATLSLTRGLTK